MASKRRRHHGRRQFLPAEPPLDVGALKLKLISELPCRVAREGHRGKRAEHCVKLFRGLLALDSLNCRRLLKTDGVAGKNAVHDVADFVDVGKPLATKRVRFEQSVHMALEAKSTGDMPKQSNSLTHAALNLRPTLRNVHRNADLDAAARGEKVKALLTHGCCTSS